MLLAQAVDEHGSQDVDLGFGPAVHGNRLAQLSEPLLQLVVGQRPKITIVRHVFEACALALTVPSRRLVRAAARRVPLRATTATLPLSLRGGRLRCAKQRSVS
jgi:hypothetical protein